MPTINRVRCRPSIWVLRQLATIGLLAVAQAKPAHGARPSAPQSPALRWHIVETDSFRLLNYGHYPLSRETAEHCERQRAELARQWFGKQELTRWTPKCDLVIHPNDSSYFREVGPGGRSTLASALVERQHGRIALRRIDIRGSRDNWLTGALAHELAHVVLADRFTTETLPRWIDEGIAILSDSPQKRRKHNRGVRDAVAVGSQFRLAELVTLSDYPPASRWSIFYDQSAVLVEFLVDQQGHAEFLSFVDLSLEHGYEHALQTVYGCDLLELERRWHRSLQGSPERTALSREPSVHETAGAAALPEAS